MRKKVLLMGKSRAGKTSMRSIIFANFIARDTVRLGPTMNVEHAVVKLLGSLVVNLWDCGGQDVYMESYATYQRDQVFRDVDTLVYVSDVESRDVEKDYRYYRMCLEALHQNSPEAKVICLIHKMDLVEEKIRERVFKDREEDMRRLSCPIECTFFRTSIWDETMFKAWSSIVHGLIPNGFEVERQLRRFADLIDADEVLLFEKLTFLVLSYCQRKPQRDQQRYEKLSNIVKQFRMSCSKLAAQLQSVEVRNSLFAAFIDELTPSTYVMVVMSDPSISSPATFLNIRNARKYFETMELR